MSKDADTPHERLEQARIAAGFEDKAKFAKAVGIHSTTYRAYENGQNGFAKLAPTFAKALGVTAEWLLHGEGGAPVKRPATPRQQVSDHATVREASASDGAIAVRKLDLSYAMGDGANLDHYYVDEEEVLFDPGFLRRITRAPAESLFVAKGDGDSMFPTLINDDEVVIDTSQRVLNMQDRIWACAYLGAGMIKRLRVTDKKTVEIRSDNETVGSQTVAADDLHIIGRVIWIGRRV